MLLNGKDVDDRRERWIERDGFRESPGVLDEEPDRGNNRGNQTNNVTESVDQPTRPRVQVHIDGRLSRIPVCSRLPVELQFQVPCLEVPLRRSSSR